MKNIAIIEDDIELKELLQKYLNMQPEFNCTTASESVEEFLESVKESPDVILSDIGLPGMSGIEGLKILKQKFPETDIVMLSVHDDSDSVFNSLCGGASGYLLKNTPIDQIKDSINILSSGGSPMSPNIARRVIDFFAPKKKIESPLSDREKDIVKGLVEGLSYKMIADKLNISIDTVRQHIRNIYRKLNVNCKAEVISKSFRGEI